MLKLKTLLAFTATLVANVTFAQINLGDYSIITRNSANFTAGAHADGAIIGTNLNANGQNLQFGENMTSNSTVALVVGGTVAANINQIALFNQAYYLANGANGVFLQNPGTALGSNPLPAGGIATLFTALNIYSTALAGLSGATPAASINGNVLTITAVAGQVNVIDLTSISGYAGFLNGANREVQFANVTDGNTKIVINYTGGGGDETFRFKTLGLSNTTYDQVLWNVRNFGQLTIGAGADSFHGSILAADTNVVWNANNLDGQLISKNLTVTNAVEFHEFSFDPLPIPEPSTYGAIGAVALVAMVGLRRYRRSRKG